MACGANNCSASCKNNCTGCTATCKKTCAGCTGTCTGNCKGCTNCSGCSGCTGCGGACKSNCSGGCKGCTSCSGSCKGCTSCSGGCKGCTGCSGGCTSCTSCSGCTNTCTGACNSGCTNSTQTSAYAALALATFLTAANINDISAFINREATRRGQSPTTVSKSAGQSVTATDMGTIKSNLSKAGQTAGYTASQGGTANATLGNDLITKAKAAYNQVIGLA